jgi:hypothetical protein
MNREGFHDTVHTIKGESGNVSNMVAAKTCFFFQQRELG